MENQIHKSNLGFTINNCNISKKYDLMKNGRCNIVIETLCYLHESKVLTVFTNTIKLEAILKWFLGCCRKKSLKKLMTCSCLLKYLKITRKGIRIRWSLASLSLCAISLPNIVVDLLGLQLGILTSFIKV